MIKKSLLVAVLLAGNAHALNIGNMTFSLPADKNFVAKQITNDNRSARIYYIDITGINQPGQNERKFRPAGGELMFTPRKMMLEAGRSDYIKFIYSGPKDDKERYYRITFREIPLSAAQGKKATRHALMEPVVALESILVVRPRIQHFRWDYSQSAGTLKNSGNTYFKVLIKQGCNGSDETANSAYLRPGETLRLPSLRGKNKKFIVTDEQYIPLGSACFETQ